MSVEASLWVYLGEYKIMDIIGVYQRRGMSVFDRDNRAFIATTDDFDYEELSVTFEELAAIIEDIENIEDKKRHGELVSVYLYEDGEPVTCLTKSAPNELDIACDVDRKTLQDGHTDVNYYIEKFIAPLEAEGYFVEGFKFWELW